MASKSSPTTAVTQTESYELGTVTVRISRFSSPGRCCMRDVPRQQTRLSIVLEELGGTVEPRLEPNKRYIKPHVRHEVALSPPGTRLWAYTDGIRKLRVLSLLFDWSELLALAVSPSLPRRPSLRTCQRDEGMLQLARLLADALEAPATGHELQPLRERYARTLVDALLLRLARSDTIDTPQRSALNRDQLRSVTRAMEHDFGTRLDIARLAASVGLSQSQFYKQFKLATGLPPYRWQLNARIRHAQTLLHQERLGLSDIAAATGFADQSHFTRVFKQVVGRTPRAWLRTHD